MQFNCNQLTKVNGEAFTNLTYGQGSEVVKVQQGSDTINSLVASGIIDVVAPDAAVIASASNVLDGNPGLVFEKDDHGLITGLVGQFTTSNALPTGLSLAVNYYVIVVDADKFMVATSLANALANTAVDYTDTGTGNQTFTPTALAGGAVTLQGSSDYDVVGANDARWVQVNSFTAAITADGTFNFELDYVRYPVYRIYVALTAGLINLSNVVISSRN